MESFNERLKLIFKKLKDCDLVISGTPDATNIITFSALLQRAAPLTESEITISNFVRHLYKENKAEFYNYIHKCDRGDLALLAGGEAIAVQLSLSGIVFIGWDNHSQEFTVNAISGPTQPTIRNRGESMGRPRSRRGHRDASTRSRSKYQKNTRPYVARSAATPPEYKLAPISNGDYAAILNSVRAPSEAQVDTPVVPEDNWADICDAEQK